MSDETARLKLQGVYPQARPGRYMLRIKLPGARLSPDQAEGLASLADRHAGGRLHLTTRMSVELHDLTLDDLPDLQAGLAALGLTSRGACGGAVRGVAVSTPSGSGAGEARALAVRIQEHFTGDPRFEGLPKKFKVGVDAGYRGARHRIQDAGFVCVGRREGAGAFDVWLAGGLGRAPRPAFRFARAIPAAAAIPLLEAVLDVYRQHAEQGKRLKHVVEARGEEWLRGELLGRLDGIDLGGSKPLEPIPEAGAELLTVPVFAGELPSARLRAVAAVARGAASAAVVLTPDQDLALLPDSAAERTRLTESLAAAGLGTAAPAASALRVCPGSHECRMGLAPTRDLARALLDRFGPDLPDVAVSGCPNSCAQPQLAAVGILCHAARRTEDGSREPRYRLLRRDGAGLGVPVAEDLTEGALFEAIGDLLARPAHPARSAA